MLIVAIPAILFAASCVMLAIALRGSKVDRHPVCRKCRFDLSGLEGIGAGGAAVACPECGSDVSGAPSVRIGNRKRRRGRVAASASMVVLTAVLAGAIGWGLATRFNWAMVLPTRVLLSEMGSASIPRRDTAIVELLRRMGEGSLSGDQALALAERTVAIQGDDQAPWTTPCGEALERVWMEKLLTDEQKYHVVRRSLGFELIIRDAAPDRVGILLNVTTDRVGPMFAWIVSPRLAFCVMDGVVVDPRPSGASAQIVLMGSGRTSIGDAILLVVGPGEHELVLRWRVVAGLGDGLTASWDEDFTERVLVREEAGFKRITDPALREAVRESIESSRVRHDVAAGTLTASVEVRNPPCNMAFEAFFIVGSRRIFAGKVLARDDHRAISVRLVGSVGELTVGDRVGLALEASAAAAESDPVMESLWGEGVEVEGLEVVREGG